MKLINTDGLALIGPGSEWFWTAMSGLVLAVTFFAIYRQLRLQRDAAATEQLNGLLGEWSSERMARAKLAILLAIRDGVEPDQLPDRTVSHIGYFLQRIGYLVRSGHMDRRLVYTHLGPQVQMWRGGVRGGGPGGSGLVGVVCAGGGIAPDEGGWVEAGVPARHPTDSERCSS